MQKEIDFAFSLQNQTNTDQSQDQKAGYRKRRLDFLDVLLTARDDQGQGLTDLEIRAEVDTFLFAGDKWTIINVLFGFV